MAFAREREALQQARSLGQTVVQALQAAAAQSAASPLNEAFSYERAAGEAVVDVIGPAEAESVGVQDFFDRYVKQIFS